jgi:hypothetical protein
LTYEKQKSGRWRLCWPTRKRIIGGWRNFREEVVIFLLCSFCAVCN